MRLTVNILAALMLVSAVIHAAPTTPSDDAMRAFLRPTTPKPAQLRALFTQIQRGALVPTPAGLITLPPKSAALTKDHRAYVTHKPHGLLLVLFPTWRGKGANLTGYLYCSRPLRPAETHKDLAEGKYPALDLLTPGPWMTGVTPVPTEILLTQRLTPTVYRVSRDMD